MPEVGFKEMGCLREPVRDGHVVELFLGGDKETAKGEPFLLGKAHAAHIKDAAVLIDQTGARMGGVRGVKSKNFFGYAASGQLKGGDGGKKLPEIFIGFLVEHSAAAAEEAMLCVSASVICAAEKVETLEHMNVLPFEAAVTHEISRGCERAEPAADDIGLSVSLFLRAVKDCLVLIIGALRLFRKLFVGDRRSGGCGRKGKNPDCFGHPRSTPFHFHVDGAGAAADRAEPHIFRGFHPRGRCGRYI